jgi:acetoin utilization deacetylase AcuC-like enzyme
LRLGFYDDALFRQHDAGPGHPERPARLEAVEEGLRRSGVACVRRACRPATEAELLRVHTSAHVARVAATAGRTVRFDPDTQASPRSYDAALHAAGAVVEAVDAVLQGALDRAFCAVRPPGHHALADRAMGFCLFNNVAVGAAHALARGIARVAIVDFDVHHGNGTEAIFAAEPRVLYVSTHAFPFYPGTGAAADRGRGAGIGTTINVPLRAGSGDTEYARVYRETLVPAVRAFDPQLVLVSAGFDAHRDDPLAGMDVTEAGYALIAQACVEMAGTAPIVVALEGGYDLEAIAASTAAVLRVLAEA